MKIGNFTKTIDGEFQGQLETLTISKEIMFISNLDKSSDKAPDYKILVDGSYREIGAGWNAKSKDDNPYIKVKIDDPSLPYTLWGALTSNDEGSYSLQWTRPNGNGSKAKAQKETL